jgi:hypothetical protein
LEVGVEGRDNPGEESEDDGEEEDMSEPGSLKREGDKMREAE